MENTENQQGENQSEDVAAWPDNPPIIDQFLWALVCLADNNTGTMDVVLMIGGCMVQGHLISEREYFEGTADAFAACFTDEHREGTRNAVLSHSVTTAAPDALNYKEDVDRHYFIHLKNATVFSGNQTFNSPLWRGKLSNVSSFILGSPSKH